MSHQFTENPSSSGSKDDPKETLLVSQSGKRTFSSTVIYEDPHGIIHQRELWSDIADDVDQSDAQIASEQDLVGESDVEADVESDNGGSDDGSDESRSIVEELDDDSMPPENIDSLIDSNVHEDNVVCSCFNPTDKLAALSLMREMRDIDIKMENSICVINNIILCYNRIFSNDNDPYSPYKVAYVHNFFKTRHELLFQLFCKCFNLPVAKSDIPFSNFGINSNRTPDLIIEVNDTIVIIEITAVSNIERAAVTKGMEQMGFESKYQREIDELVDSGRSVLYRPLFFNMGDIKNPVNNEQFRLISELFPVNRIYKSILNVFSKHIAIFTNETRSSISFPAMIYFTETESIEANHESHKFLYTNAEEGIDINENYVIKDDSNFESGNSLCRVVDKTPKKRYFYKNIIVSKLIYNKIINSWERLTNMISNSRLTDKDNGLFVINTATQRITLEYNPLGVHLGLLHNFILNNDKINVFRNTYIKTGDKLIPSIGSETGVKFVETTDISDKKDTFREIQVMANHSRSEYNIQSYNKMWKFESKCKMFKSQDIKCNYFDQDYEDQLIKSIVEFDQKNQIVKDLGNINLLNTKKKFLAQLNSENIDVEGVLDKIKTDYVYKNTDNDSIPRTILKMKSPFILPLGSFNQTSYCSLDFKNIKFINDLLQRIKDSPFTTLILEKVKDESYKMYSTPNLASSSLQKLMNTRSEVSSKINRLYKISASFEGKKLKNTADPSVLSEYNKLKNEYNLLNREINNRKNVEKIGQDISYLRLPIKNKNSRFNSLYKLEMQHFKDKKVQSTIEGVGLIDSINTDYDKDKEIFDNLLLDLVVNCGENPDKIMSEHISDDVVLLKDLKNRAIEDYKGLINQVNNSALGHSSSFVSRLGHSLMFYSQQPFSSDYVRVDNLGYCNVLLIVRGGKKIFKSKSSKLFRIIYPTYETIIPWYNHGHANKGSTQVINIDGQSYIVSPWHYLHENVLTDSISFHHRVCSFTALNLDNKIDFGQQFHKVFFNILLSFHNRRQTEVVLANLRYILLSTMGDFTGLTDILDEFFGFNYDCIQSFVRNSIMINYPNYFKTILKIKASDKSKDINESSLINNGVKHIFTNADINKSEDLALMIYSTFLMTKAPYQKLAERASNLKGILKIHEQYSEEVGLNLTPKEQLEKLNVSCDGDYLEYTNKLFDNDFNFDAKYCALIGNFMDSYFINEGLTDHFHSEWVKILNMNWDEMATSTGLRGEYGKIEDFWGQKGYFVIYKKLLNNVEFKNSLYMLLNSNLSDNEKRKILRGMNKLYKEAKTEDEFLIFHAVDKSQWRGGREIYVMNINTKIMQQPIEKFMGVICTKIDNELISVPSDRRAQVIHHSIFEKDLPLKEVLTWYLTLDCSKWAPKSIFVKFALCINNMSCIPNSFKIHFMNYMEKLFNKRLYFNVGEVEVLNKNPIYKDVCDKYLIKDENMKGYYLEAPYSWVMGIFNYTSSFLHAANQKYFSYLLTKSTSISYQEDVSMVMYAHSDDSGGRLCVPDKGHLIRALFLYEVNLHSANHLLSKKKSTVSRIYFEILSIIYLFKKLLALLPKFLGGLRFLPTDKGPAQDILQSYSKCIEVIIAGADFSLSYLVLKIMSHLIFKFYFNKDPNADDYSLPVQYMGMPDAHPLMILLCGSDADLIRLSRNNECTEKLIDVLSYVNSVTENLTGEGPIKPLKFKINIKNLSKDFDVYIEFFQEVLKTWSVSNVNYHNTGMNTLSFLKKLNDPGFVGSLVNESVVRRISRSYYFRNSYSLITRWGGTKIKSFRDGLKIFISYLNHNNAIKEILHNTMTTDEIDNITKDFELSREDAKVQIEIFKKTMVSPLRLNEFFNKLTLEGRSIIKTNKTLKPVLVQLTKGHSIFSSDFDPASLVSYIKEPELTWSLNNVKNLQVSRVELLSYLDKINKNVDEIKPDLLLRICRTFGRENVKNIYLYSRVPSNVRHIKTYSAFLTFLSVNSISGYEIGGLTIKMSDKESGKEYLMSHISEEIYFVNNTIYLLLLLFEKCDKEFINSLQFREFPDIGFEGGSVLELYNCMVNVAMNNAEGVIVQIQLSILYSYISNSPVIISDALKKGAYYTFLKEQKIRDGWYGKGEVYISIFNSFYSFEIENKEITSLITNRVGKIDSVHERYIQDVFEQIGVTIPKTKISTKVNQYCFGYDYSGSLSIMHNREMERGVVTIIKDSRGGVIEEMEFYEVVNVFKDQIFLKFKSETEVRKRKIYTLPLKKAELIAILRSIIKVSDFDLKMAQMGLNDFEDFLMTELMPELGTDLQIDFEQMMDNYSASRLYEILNKTMINNYSEMPKKIQLSVLPAPPMSMIRILIDYSNNTNDQVIRSPNYIDSNIMRLRSEYPEQVVTILLENIIKNYNSIYSGEERNEITNSYMKLINCGDLNIARNELIKLMSYWGYATLVNNIEEFKLNRTVENYVYFNLGNLQKNVNFFSNVFIELTVKICQTISDCSSFISVDNYPLQTPSIRQNPVELCRNYVISICYELYGLVRPNIITSHNGICFNNLLLNCLTDEDIIVKLRETIYTIPIFNSVIIDYKNRYNFIIMYNTLKYVWQMNNKIDFNLKYNIKLQRFPDNVPSVVSLLKKFEMKVGPASLYYHNFIRPEFLNFINSLSEMWVSDDKVFRSSMKFLEISKIYIPVVECLKVKRPIKQDTLEHENWEEVVEECKMSDIDEDTIVMLWDEIENKYVKKVTKTQKLKNYDVILSSITWVFEPYRSSKQHFVNYMRQCGENVILLTDVQTHAVFDLPYSGARIIDIGKLTKTGSKEVVAYYTFQKELHDEDFISKILGNRGLDINIKCDQLIKPMDLRDSDGVVKKPYNLGTLFTGEQLMGQGMKYKTVNDVLVPIIKGGEDDTDNSEDEESDIDAEGVENDPNINDDLEYVSSVNESNNDRGSTSQFDKSDNEDISIKLKKIKEEDELKKYNTSKKVNKYIDDVTSDLQLDEETSKALKEKYNSNFYVNIGLEKIFQSVMGESILKKMNQDVVSNEITMSRTQQTKMMQNPAHFGMVYGGSKFDKDPIKDKKLKAEINSIHPELSNFVVSSRLTISKRYRKTLEAHYKMWYNMVKHTDFKTLNKRFLLQIFIALLNNAQESEEEGQDLMWHNIIDRFTEYFAQTLPDSDEDDEMFNSAFGIIPGARLKYRGEGT